MKGKSSDSPPSFILISSSGNDFDHRPMPIPLGRKPSLDGNSTADGLVMTKATFPHQVLVTESLQKMAEQNVRSIAGGFRAWKGAAPNGVKELRFRNVDPIKLHNAVSIEVRHGAFLPVVAKARFNQWRVASTR